jgi:predicted nucleic acid-binding protein
MAVTVFGADVLIGFLNQDDAQHDDAVHRVRAALTAGGRRMLCAVNYSEVLIGPMRIGAAATVETMIARLGIEIIPADAALAERAATVQVQTGLKRRDAYARRPFSTPAYADETKCSSRVSTHASNGPTLRSARRSN